MTVTLPESSQVAIPLAKRYGPIDRKNWHINVLPADKSPVDLSFLNHKPAGSRGFVRAQKDKLVFTDGSEARFWGGNIAAYAIFAKKEQIKTQAKRIAQLGYNLMRIHHHDSTRWVKHTVIDKNRQDSQHLDQEVMQRLDYWIKCLRDEGVYVWLDLHVGRSFKVGDDIGEGFDEMTAYHKNKAGPEGKGYCYFNPRIEELMKDFNEKYLNHVNSYTGLAYKDDPAIMGILITNENDITHHFGNMLLPDKNNPYHNKIFDAAVRKFATHNNLPYEKTWQTWQPGPAKLFLADREYQWNTRMLSHLDKIGVKVPVATTQMWGNMIMSGLPSLAAGSIIDMHSYGKAEALSSNPRHADNYISWIATGQLYNKPLSITEWNVPFPHTDRFTAPLYVAAISALQQWDAPMIYNYSQREFANLDRADTWSSFIDPAITAIMPAAALMYRQQHVKPATKSYCIELTRDNLYYRDSNPANMATIRTLVEQSKIYLKLPDVKELDWDTNNDTPDKDMIRLTDIDRDFIPAGREYVESDTAQIKRNWVKGFQTIDTDKTQAAQGWIGNRKIKLKHSSFDIKTAKAAIAISALDSKPINISDKILITVVGRVVSSESNRLPFYSEPVKGTIIIATDKKLTLIPLSGDGKELEPVTPSYGRRSCTITLPCPRGTHWYLLINSNSQ